MTDRPTTTVEWITHYMRHGLSPIPTNPGEKRPLAGLSGWEKLELASWDLEEAEALWSDAKGEPGVGLLLGAPSGGLVDIDLDCLEAATIAGAALPRSLTSGRPSARSSHRWYRVAENTEALSTTKWIDSVREQRIATARERGGGADLDRAVLLELRWTGAQTLVEPSTWHPRKGEAGNPEPYEWEGELTELAEIDGIDLLHNMHLLAAASILARYWPYEGSRHDASVALCGALAGNHLGYWSGDGGSGLPMEAFLHAVRVVGGDDEYRAPAVRTTLRRLERGGKVQGWPTLAEIYERREAQDAVWQAKEWIDTAMELVGARPTPTIGDTDDLRTGDEEETGALGDIDPDDEDEREELLTAVDLVQALAEGVPDVEWTLPGLLVAGQVHGIVGYPGSGKSLLSLWMLDEILRGSAGASVMYIDEENGLAETLRRVEALDIPPSRLRRLHYYAFPGLNLKSTNHFKALLDEIEERDPALIVVDSMVDMLVASGLSQNENDEVAWFYKHTIEPLRRDGRTVLLHDHLAKHDATKTKGAGAKDELVQAVWSVSVVEKFDRENIGSIRLTRRKDRTGYLPAEQHIYVIPNPETGLTRLSMPIGQPVGGLE